MTDEQQKKPRRRKRRPHDSATETVMFKVPLDVSVQIDTIVDRISQEHPGLRPTRAQVARSLMITGLKAVKKKYDL